jgi:hypothetical protein
MHSSIKTIGATALAIALTIFICMPRGQAQQPAYVVDGLPLGGKVKPESSAYSEFQCGPSREFRELTWCQKRKRSNDATGPINIIHSILHLSDGEAVYVDQSVTPAYFKGSDIPDQIMRLNKRFGLLPNIMVTPEKAKHHGLIVSWGNILLERIPDGEAAVVAAGRYAKSEVLFDFLGDFQKSAKAGLPTFRITGGAGYIWSASYDERGVGHLRFLAANALRFGPVAVTTDRKEISRPVAPADSSTIADNDRTKADAAQESQRQKVADATALTLKNVKQDAEQARMGAGQAQAFMNWNSVLTSENLTAAAVLGPVLLFGWITLTITILHGRGVYFWSLGSTWVTIVGCIIALGILIATVLVKDPKLGNPLLVASGLLYAFVSAYSFFYNWKATRSVFLALSTTLLQQFSVLGVIFIWLRFFNNPPPRQREYWEGQ